MDEVIAEFPWASERTHNEICRVKIKEGGIGTNVHTRGYADNVPRSGWITFRPEKLPNIIAALQKADEKLNAR